MRRMQVLPFNLLMVDGEEANWGEFQPEDASRKILWTNDSTQIGILRRAFENMWLELGNIEDNISSSRGHVVQKLLQRRGELPPSNPNVTKMVQTSVWQAFK